MIRVAGGLRLPSHMQPRAGNSEARLVRLNRSEHSEQGSSDSGRLACGATHMRGRLTKGLLRRTVRSPQWSHAAFVWSRWRGWWTVVRAVSPPLSTAPEPSCSTQKAKPARPSCRRHDELDSALMCTAALHAHPLALSHEFRRNARRAHSSMIALILRCRPAALFCGGRAHPASARASAINAAKCLQKFMSSICVSRAGDRALRREGDNCLAGNSWPSIISRARNRRRPLALLVSSPSLLLDVRPHAAASFPRRCLLIH